MGHVINPISLRVGYTVGSDLVWKSVANYNYSYVLFKTRFVIAYINRIFLHPSLKYNWLLNSSKVFFANSRYYSFISLYSQRVIIPTLQLYERFLNKKKRFARYHSRKRWLIFSIIRNYYLSSCFFTLSRLIERDVRILFGIELRHMTSFVSQEDLTARSWVTFIKNKLKKNTHFSGIMRNVMPILNQLMYDDEMLMGYKITCSGRTSRRGRASFSIRSRGNLPLSTVVAFVSYAFGTIVLKNSICGIKVWLFYKKRPKLFDYFIAGYAV